MNDNPYRYQIPGHRYVGELHRRIADGMLFRGEHFGIVGGRRCGKTSIIKVLENYLGSGRLQRPFVPVSIYVTSFDQISPGALFRRILETMTAGLAGYRWDEFAGQQEPYRAFTAHVEGAVGRDLTHRYGSDWIVVLLVDEIDNLATRLDGAGYGDTFFGNLRNLVTEHNLYGNFRLVVTGVNDPEGVIRHGSPFAMLVRQELGVLSDENTDTLVEAGFPRGIARPARERLAELTGRHPYLLQGVLQKLWRADAMELNGDAVERAANSFQREHNDFSRWLHVFDGVTRMAYGYLSAHPEQKTTFAELAGALSQRARGSTSGEDIEDALSVLVTHGVIEQKQEEYCISGTMFRDWYDSHAPVVTTDVVEILDQLNGIIEGLGISAADRRRAQDQLATARGVFSRGGDGDPGSVKREGSEAIERLWHIVKRVSDAATLAEKLKELAPLLGSAASWVLRIVIGSG